MTSDCNQYLALSAILYAGLYGLQNNITNMTFSNYITEYSNEDLCQEIENNSYFLEKFGSRVTKKLEETLRSGYLIKESEVKNI